ncbi:hypothetical protein [Larkinella soli]|uniref:hypothetical protein n=1 Tax=Larkinella soli TaxID=1770527 RepID=UPI000FFC3420|nr:hypothetical protein [Larkinella soli]
MKTLYPYLLLLPAGVGVYYALRWVHRSNLREVEHVDLLERAAAQATTPEQIRAALRIAEELLNRVMLPGSEGRVLDIQRELLERLNGLKS